MKVVESSNLSKLFATRLKTPEAPQDKDKAKRIEGGLAAGVENTLDAAKSLSAVSKGSESAEDVADAVKEASNSRVEDVDGLVQSLSQRIQSNPQQAFAAQTNKQDIQKISDLLR